MPSSLAALTVVLVLSIAAWVVVVTYRRTVWLVQHPVLRPLVEDGTVDLPWFLAYARLGRVRSRRGGSPYACAAWLLVLVDPATPGADRVARLYLREAIRRGPPFWLVAFPGVPAGRACPEDVPVMVLSEPAERDQALEYLRQRGVPSEDLQLPLEAASWLGVERLDAAGVTPMEVSRTFDQVLRIRRALDGEGALARVERWCDAGQVVGSQRDAEAFVACLERVARGEAPRHPTG